MIDPQKEWELVEAAWYGDAPECNDCEFKRSEYFTDTGREDWCLMLDAGSGNPQFCAAYDRLVEEMDL